MILYIYQSQGGRYMQKMTKEAKRIKQQEDDEKKKNLQKESIENKKDRTNQNFRLLINQGRW